MRALYYYRTDEREVSYEIHAPPRPEHQGYARERGSRHARGGGWSM